MKTHLAPDNDEHFHNYLPWDGAKNNMKNVTYIINNWSIDLTSGFITHQVTQEQKRLGEYQLKLISVLLEHAGQILSREQLTTLVWKRRVIGNNSLPNAIHTLRMALGDKNKQQRIIQTIPKMGYLLDTSFCELIEKSAKAELESPTEPMTGDQALFSSTAPRQIVEATELAANSPKNEHTATAQVTILAQNNHAVVPILGATNSLQRIFNSRRLSASLLLVIIIITSFSYLLLQQQERPQYPTIEKKQEMYNNTVCSGQPISDVR
ncbi:putative regulatory protein [Yersinia aldovae]|nr:putative regulatory protein [Yersinia aldovae]